MVEVSEDSPELLFCAINSDKLKLCVRVKSSSRSVEGMVPNNESHLISAGF